MAPFTFNTPPAGDLLVEELGGKTLPDKWVCRHSHQKLNCFVYLTANSWWASAIELWTVPRWVLGAQETGLLPSDGPPLNLPWS